MEEKPKQKRQRNPIYFDEVLQCEVKKCSNCGVIKPVTEFNKRLDSIRPNCRVCSRAETKHYYELSADQRRQYAREYGQKHKEQRSASYAARKEANREKRLAYYQQRYRKLMEENPNHCKEHHAKYRERERAYFRSDRARRMAHKRWNRWYTQNKEYSFAKSYRYMARKRKASGAEIIYRSVVIERDNSTCYICGQVVARDNIHLDHVIPLSRGGTHTYDNVKVTCSTCNLRKHNKLLSEMCS